MMPSASEFFCRNLGTLTPAQQQVLHQQRVAVVGCGGLGGYVCEQLVRLGVGTLHLFDPDTFAPSNGNRQLGALQTTLGRNKAEVMAERAAAIHPWATTRVFATDFRRVRDEAAFRVQVVVDCLDSVSARRDLAALCGWQNLPLVHGAVSGWYGQVGVQLPAGTLLERLYPPRTVATETAPSVLVCTVALVASLQVAETLKLLLGLPSELHQAWMAIDLRSGDFVVNPL